jgi:hypothetical protein
MTKLIIVFCIFIKAPKKKTRCPFHRLLDCKVNGKSNEGQVLEIVTAAITLAGFGVWAKRLKCLYQQLLLTKKSRQFQQTLAVME